nr:hypothetical protein KK1_047654 [Cajanus cajan]
MIQTGVSRDIPEAEASNAPEPSSSYDDDHLSTCAAKLDPGCGDEIFSAVFYGSQTISGECCDTLVSDAGKACHDDMTKYILKLKKFPNEHQILHRSENVWNACVALDYPAAEPVAVPSDESLYN